MAVLESVTTGCRVFNDVSIGMAMNVYDNRRAYPSCPQGQIVRGDGSAN
jgi:hypothetical protein